MKTGHFSFLEAGLLLATVFAPLAFGSVYDWASMAVVSLIFFLLFCYPEAIFEFSRLPRLFRYGMVLVYVHLFRQWGWTALNGYTTGVTLLKWLAYGGMFLLSQLLPRKSLLRILVALIVVATLEAVYGVFQVSGGVEMVLWQKKKFHLGFATGTYWNRNHFAGLLELAIGVHLGFLLRAFHKKDFRGILFLALLLFVLLCGLIRSGSRVGILSLSLATFIFSFFLWHRSLRSLSFFILLVTVTACVSVFLGWSIIASRFSELGDQFLTLEGRMTAWRDAMRMIRDYFWTGVGLGNFGWVFRNYQSESLIYGWSHAHNDYLELLAELGVPFFCVFVASFLSLYLHCLWFADRSDPSSFSLVWGGLIAVTSLGFHALTDFNWVVPANAMLSLLIFAVLVRFSRFRRFRVRVKK